jgi:TPR repeat protein
MKKLILSLLCIASLSFATTFEDGVDAFESKDYKTALKVFEELGLKDDIKSQYNLGIIYSNGYGIKKDEKKALEWYEKAAVQGLKEAQHEVALYFEQGRIVDKNLQKAADLYDSACSSGLEKSCRQYNKLARKGFESSSKKELENGINYYNNKDFKYT